MSENAKIEILNGKGDLYFERNMKNFGGKIEVATGCKLFEEFLYTTTHNEKLGVVGEVLRNRSMLWIQFG